MPYDHDRELSKLFFPCHFFDAHNPTADPWTAIPGATSEGSPLLAKFLRALPGPAEEKPVTWRKKHNQRVLLEWVRPPSLAAKLDTFPGIPHICIFALRTFTGLRTTMLEIVPKEEREKYAKDFPALTVRWMIEDAARAWKDPRVRDVALKFHKNGASARFILLLSFIPIAVFKTWLTRAQLQRSRSKLNPMIKRYQNPSTKLSGQNPYERELLEEWQRAEFFKEDVSDADKKKWIISTLKQLPRQREREVWSKLGLDKNPEIALSRQAIWDGIVPLLEYLVPFAPKRKDDHSRDVWTTSDSLFSLTSELLAARYPSYWKDSPGRLKGRLHYHRRLTASSS